MMPEIQDIYKRNLSEVTEPEMSSWQTVDIIVSGSTMIRASKFQQKKRNEEAEGEEEIQWDPNIFLFFQVDKYMVNKSDNKS